MTQQDHNYAPGKITKGKNVSYKAFVIKQYPHRLFVTNSHSQDSAVLTTFYKNGKKVGEDEEFYLDTDFSYRELRDSIVCVFTNDELQNYKQKTPGIEFIVKFDENGYVSEVYFVFIYNVGKKWYDALLDISPDKLYELEKQIRNIVKIKKDDELAKFKNFKSVFFVEFFEEDE